MCTFDASKYFMSYYTRWTSYHDLFSHFTMLPLIVDTHKYSWIPLHTLTYTPNQLKYNITCAIFKYWRRTMIPPSVDNIHFSHCIRRVYILVAHIYSNLCTCGRRKMIGIFFFKEIVVYSIDRKPPCMCQLSRCHGGLPGLGVTK